MKVSEYRHARHHESTQQTQLKLTCPAAMWDQSMGVDSIFLGLVSTNYLGLGVRQDDGLLLGISNLLVCGQRWTDSYQTCNLLRGVQVTYIQGLAGGQPAGNEHALQHPASSKYLTREAIQLPGMEIPMRKVGIQVQSQQPWISIECSETLADCIAIETKGPEKKARASRENEWNRGCVPDHCANGGAEHACEDTRYCSRDDDTEHAVGDE